MSAPDERPLGRRLFEPRTINSQAIVPQIATYVVLLLWSLIVIGSLVSIIPLVIAFLSLQKYWQGGLSIGSLK